MFAISWIQERGRSAPIAVFLVALVVYAAVAGNRLLTQSSDPHFVAQASAWLQGRLYLERWPAGADDPAVVGTRFHVAFPPFPAAVFVPVVLVFGPAASDVVVTVLLAALAPALLLVVLRRLRERGLSTRSPRDDVWFAALLSFGTVLFFSSVQGRVWYTAHVIAVDLCLLYVWASIDAGHPLLAGACVGLGFLTRAPTLFMFPLFVEEMWRSGGFRNWRRWAAFAAPVAVAGILAAWHNYARFADATEFGYSYLAVRQQHDIATYGLFNPHYLTRNLIAAFALLPDVRTQPPYISISGHGLAMWITTPALLLLFRAWPRSGFQCGLWITAASVAIWTLFYQNTGWFQFGYRFSLDYIVFLVLILVVDGRPLTRIAHVLLAASIAINTFGAMTFARYPQFYRADLATYRALVHD